MAHGRVIGEAASADRRGGTCRRRRGHRDHRRTRRGCLAWCRVSCTTFDGHDDPGGVCRPRGGCGNRRGAASDNLIPPLRGTPRTSLAPTPARTATSSLARRSQPIPKHSGAPAARVAPGDAVCSMVHVAGAGAHRRQRNGHGAVHRWINVRRHSTHTHCLPPSAHRTSLLCPPQLVRSHTRRLHRRVEARAAASVLPAS
jgi:hypothetical protein